LVLGPDGNFYGTTSYGGADGIGEIYRLDLPPEIIQPPPASPPCRARRSLYQSRFLAQDLIASMAVQWHPIVAATNCTLTIPSFAAGDAADYSVIIRMLGAASPAPWHCSRRRARP